MAEPPGVERYGGGPARGVAALAGILIGAGVLAALVWAGVRGGEDEPAPVTTVAAATPAAAAKPVLRIVFPEGFTRNQMAARITAVNRIAKRKRGIEPSLSRQAYLKATARSALPAGFEAPKAKTLEGFLFPATYEFDEDTKSQKLVAMQLDAFERAWSKLDLGYAKARNLTPYDVLVIASMVEKEVVVAKERALVAAVIYNRLRTGLPLGIDATIRYGLGIPPTEAIRQSQLESDNPYNTRRFTGLPPTPIANPGLASLEAAARPRRVDYLYFIRKADCRSHFFTASEQEFFDYPRTGLDC